MAVTAAAAASTAAADTDKLLAAPQRRGAVPARIRNWTGAGAALRHLTLFFFKKTAQQSVT
ncbi:MAG: hypothetical protein QOH57_5025 [Mycobacterium sp.]|jgi:hypothetical protein|nr:hypothetical protein [Mycobacterium sp.]